MNVRARLNREAIVVEANPSPFSIFAQETCLLNKQLSLLGSKTLFFNHKHFFFVFETCFQPGKWKNISLRKDVSFYNESLARMCCYLV